MVHGSPVTLADMNPLLQTWRKGFGKTVLDPDVIVGNWTHYVVDTLSESAGAGNTLREALASSTPYYITFDPALGTGTLTLLSDMPFRENKFIDGTGVRITIAGNPSLETAAGYLLWTSGNQNRGRFGAYNIIFANGGSGDGVRLADSYATTGRAFWLWMFCEFHGNNPILDDTIDCSGRPTLGHYTTQVGCWFGPNSGTTNWDRCQVFGNNRDDQSNHHGRATLLRCAYYGSTSARINFRTPLATDWHIEDIETYRECGNRTVIIRNNSVANLRRAIFRSRYSVWDIAKSSAGSDHVAHDGGSSSALPYVRIRNQYETNGGSALSQGTLNLGEHDAATVTDNFVYVDESGTLTPEYNDYTPGTFGSMTGPQVRTYLRGFAKWRDHITLGGTALGAEGGSLAGTTLTFTNSVDNWPTLSNSQKQLFLSECSVGGDAWSDVITQTVAAMAADIGSGGSTNIINTSGKTLTVTFPDEVDTVFFPTHEDVTFEIVNTYMTRSAHLPVADTFTIEATSPPGEVRSFVYNKLSLAAPLLTRARWGV